ncbi:MAG: hypothetical protein GDA41_02975 [Rhodospirillales bacterium]|nr:hypothetical protein [Rhodospirillales bacterium]
MSLVSEVKDKTDPRCHTQNIRRDGYSIDVRCEPQPWLALDFDLPGSPLGENDRRPDFLFVGDKGGGRGRLASVEISKGKDKSADKIVAQLQAGANWAAGKLSDRHKPRLLPLYLGKLNRYAIKEIKKKDKRVTFRGQAELIIWLTAPGSRIP